MKNKTVAIAHAQESEPKDEGFFTKHRGGAVYIIDTWAVELKKYAMELHYDVVDISGPDLTYERMTEILQVTKPAILFYFGLGSRTCLIGNDMECILTIGADCKTPTCTVGWQQPKFNAYNLQAVKDIAVIAYSSLAAQQLGPEIIKAGSPCFVGFSDQLIVVSDKYGTQDIFKEFLLPLARRILQGWTVGAAVEETRRDLLASIRKHRPFELIPLSLYSNIKSLKYLGDPNWKLKAGGN